MVLLRTGTARPALRHPQPDCAAVEIWERYTLVASAIAALPFTSAQNSVSVDINTCGEDDTSGTPYQTFMFNADVKQLQPQINSNKTGLAKGYICIDIDGQPTSGQNYPTIFGPYILTFEPP